MKGEVRDLKAETAAGMAFPGIQIYLEPRFVPDRRPAGPPQLLRRFEQPVFRFLGDDQDVVCQHLEFFGVELGVAAGDDQQGRGVPAGQTPDQAAGLLFALGGDGTGVDNIEVGGALIRTGGGRCVFLGRRTHRKTLAPERGGQGLGFVLIELTPEGVE